MPASRKFFQRRKKRRSSSSLSKTSPTSASGLAACSETSLRTLAAKPSKLSSAEKDVPSPASRSKRPSQEACSNVRSSISFLQPDGRKLLACCQSSKRPVAAAVRRSSASLIIARRSASVCITVMLCRLLIVVVTSCGAPRFSQDFPAHGGPFPIVYLNQGISALPKRLLIFRTTDSAGPFGGVQGDVNEEHPEAWDLRALQASCCGAGRGSGGSALRRSVRPYLMAATFWPARRPKTRQSRMATEPRRTAPCTPPVASPAAKRWPIGLSERTSRTSQLSSVTRPPMQ